MRQRRLCEGVWSVGRTRRAHVTAGLAAAAPWLAACGAFGDTAGAGGGGAPPTRVPGTRTRTTFLHRWQPPNPWGVAMQQALHLFRERHREIELEEVDVPPNQLLEKLVTLVAAATPPDVWFGFERLVPPIAAKGLAAPMDAYMKRDAREVKPEDFFLAVYEGGKVDGKLYAMPTDVNIMVTYLNKTRFAATGTPLPEANWTWDTMLDAARKLTREEEGTKRFGVRIEFWQPVVWSQGGEVLDRAGKRCLLAEPAAANAIQFVGDLAFRHGVAARGDEIRALPGPLFDSDRWGMFMGGVQFLQRARTNLAFDWDVTSLPRGSKGRATNLVHASYGVAQPSRDKDAAWQLVKHLAMPEVQRLWAAPGQLLPARKSVADTGVFLKTPPEHVRVFVDDVQYGRYRIMVPQYVEVEQAINEEIDKVLVTGEATARAAAEAACRKVQALLGQ